MNDTPQGGELVQTVAVSDTLAASGRLSVAIMASRVLGLLREVVFAALFGLAPIADAYQVAFRIPNLLRDLLAEGALSSAFVPTFSAALQNEGREAADALANLALGGILVVTGLLTALGMVFAEPLVVLISDEFGGDPEKVRIAADLTRIMMPILALVSLGAVWMGMLNAQRRFVAPALAPALFNVVSVAVGLALFGITRSPMQGVLVWSWGTLAAGGAQAALQLAALWRMGYRPRLAFRGMFRHPGIRRIVRLMGPAVIGLAAVQINVFVNTRFAGNLPDGAVSALGYAFRLFFLPLGVFGVAIATVTTTSVSEAAAGHDRSEIARRAAQSVSAGFMLTTASAVGLFVLADPIVTLIYQHGKTTPDDVRLIATVLQAYVLGLVPYSLVKILAPAFYGVDRPGVPLTASAMGVAVNIAFNAFTYQSLGAPGLALGTTLGAATNVLVLQFMFGRRIGSLTAGLRVRSVVALALANGVLGGLVGGLWQLFAMVRSTIDPRFAWPVDAAVVLGLVLVGFFAYAKILAMLDYPGGATLLRLPAKLLGRLRRR